MRHYNVDRYINKCEIISDIEKFCIKNHIVSFSDIVNYSKKNNYEWYKALVTLSYAGQRRFIYRLSLINKKK